MGKLLALTPGLDPDSTYWEPFLGAGSMFFGLRPARAVLSDSNPDLMDCYMGVRESPARVSDLLELHQKMSGEAYYYEVRAAYNDGDISHLSERAAAFIYLNKTCFNGIWRVNTKGHFNVPYGYKEPPAIPSRDYLMRVSTQLRTAVLGTNDFRLVTQRAMAGDFVYLDPPYPPVSTTSVFQHYTRKRFSWKDQIEVAKVADALRKQGCKVMVSNVDTPQIREMYPNFTALELDAARSVRANGRSPKAREIALINYRVPQQLKPFGIGDES